MTVPDPLDAGGPRPGRPGRDRRIDFWRGLCLVGMACWHLMTDTAGQQPSPFPGWLAFPVIQAFNFVAEGFVLLAGVSVGLTSARHPEQGLRAAHYVRRAAIVMAAHYAVAGAIVSAFPARAQAPPWLADAGTAGKLAAVTTLLYQPYLGDILSLFVFLFLATPGLLAVRRAYGLAGLLAISGGVYLAANVLPVAGLEDLRRQIEPNRGGAFDLWTWQFVFASGIVLGQTHGAWMPRLERARGTWLAAAAAAFLAAAAVRLGVLKLADLPEAAGDLIFGRNPLTPPRLAYIGLEMVLIALLTLRFWPLLAALGPVREIERLGRHSLVVFVASVFLDYGLKSVMARFGVRFPFSLLVLAAELALLAGLAAALDRRRGR